MNKQAYMDQAEQFVLHTYNRFPLVIDHGEGVYVYDTDGSTGMCRSRKVLSVDSMSSELL